MSVSNCFVCLGIINWAVAIETLWGLWVPFFLMYGQLVSSVNLEKLFSVDCSVDRYRVFVGSLRVGGLRFVPGELVQVVAEVIWFLRVYFVFCYFFLHLFLFLFLFWWQK